jgi:drug/metabolite transporter (DMT)-like permease
MTLQLGILLALFSALVTNLSFLLKHKGAAEVRPVTMRHPVRSAAALFRSKWFALGWGVAVLAWCFHVGALSLAPLSVVQAVLSGGLVFLTVLAERWFGCSLGRRQWIGVGCTAVGLVLLTITLPGHAGDSSGYSTAGMIAFEATLLAIGTFLVFSPGLGNHQHHGVLLGAAAGILFGVSDVAIKALTTSIGQTGVIGLLSPWALTCVAASVLAFYASARGLQKGEAVPVITLTSAAANVSAISGGILVFGDPMASDPLGIVVQTAAFVLVIVAAALTPAPLRLGNGQPVAAH